MINFVLAQQTARDLIAANSFFVADAATTVFVDLGFSKSLTDAALNIPSLGAGGAGKGYAVSVWPATRGSAAGEEAGQTGVESTFIVRLEANPQQLKIVDAAHASDSSKPTAVEWFNTFVAAVISSLLSADPELGGVKWELAGDAFELTNFDEGLIAYHIRFKRFTVFGS